jgi:DNA-binding beta-propeller fold protein YncE
MEGANYVFIFREVIMKTGRLTRYVIARPDLSGRSNLIGNNFQMPLRYLILTILLFILLLSNPAFSYEIQILGNIPLKDKISGIGYHTSGIVAISSDTKTLYIIDTPSGKILKKIPLNITPTGVVIDPKRNSAIISSSDGALQFIDLNTGNPVKTISASAINALAINPPSPPFSKGGMGGFSDTLYIATSNTLLLMDLETGDILKETPLPYTPISMAIDQNLGYLLMITNESVIAMSSSNEAISKLYIYNSDTLEFITEINPTFPSIKRGLRGVSVNPSTHIVVLTNSSDSNLTIISLSSDIMNPASVIDTISFYSQPDAIAIDPTRNLALITHKEGIGVIKLENPIPEINTLIPKSARAGDSGFTLSIKGERFIRDTKARFDTKELATTFEDNYNLQADVLSSELQTQRDVPVTVTNPPPGGGISNTLTFRIYNPAPILESIYPDTIYQPLAISHQPINLKVTGRNFLNGSKVNLNGENLKTRFISSILLEAEINPNDIKSIGKYIVVVINPSPGAFTSNPLYLNVVEELPSAISPQPSALMDQTSGIRDQTSDKHQASGIGHLRGRILNTHKQPVGGVTVQIRNIKAVTDSDGYFTLENVPAGKMHLMIHGSTAMARYKETRHQRETESYHPTIPLTVNIDSGKTNEMPFQIYLHKQKNWDFKHINPNEETVLTDQEVPGFEMRIPKGVNIKGWDGKPNQKVSVRTVPTDRLPVKPLPDNAYVKTIYMFYFDKVGGGIPDEPIPVKYPNDLGLLPGQKAVIWYYDESPNEGEAPNDWAIAGTGTVTPDGRYIVSDPGVGIPKFCCGATGPGCQGACPPGPGPDPCP